MKNNMRDILTADLSTDTHLLHGAEPAQPDGCPPWCSEHPGEDPGEEPPPCGRLVTQGASISVVLEDGQPALVTDDYDWLPERAATECALALLEGCERVENVSAGPGVAGA